MRPRIDIAGQRFGALVALRFVPGAETADHCSGWLVRCDCGNEKVVNAKNLRTGKITSCGCHAERGRRRSEAGNPKRVVDYTGQKFNELTAIQFLSHGTWRFRCSCGKEIAERIGSVKSGKVKSCGHVLKEVARERIAKDGGNVLGYYDGTIISRLRKIMASPNACGIQAVHLSNGGQCYTACIHLRRKKIYLGRFADYESAICARREAEKKYFLPVIEAYEEEERRKNGNQ